MSQKTTHQCHGTTTAFPVAVLTQGNCCTAEFGTQSLFQQHGTTGTDSARVSDLHLLKLVQIWVGGERWAPWHWSEPSYKRGLRKTEWASSSNTSFSTGDRNSLGDWARLDTWWPECLKLGKMNPIQTKLQNLSKRLVDLETIVTC